ncbi:16S rRNA (guanine(966)-N(2))-methyltransferase RsmD [Rhodothalassium salexigens]|uniref:16S rRNA (guanine(966)-N(2))-methyltransferase RsmD n=1 Tax=Rhodothalassium salexigens TaxID=1086 RepID=UPI00191436F8|nr:16S rRNA (guanine(966)-N(2))-methyltransferase RsmD [Rhodothalassium salexigens]MBK5911395.1 16S rRNA (guanine(966)-N(2))-methyltransferase RsmD [Rhodothalassium salexigens]
MRIVAGRYRGVHLPSPVDRAIRPTTDRLRERLFNILQHRQDPSLAGARVADLFAGTGALGFEALSRGAAHVTFVDQSPEARRLIAQTRDRLGVADQVATLAADATRLPRCPGPAMDLILLDPPYAKDLITPTLAALAAGGWLRPGGLVAVESSTQETITPPSSLVERDRRNQKNTQLVLYTYTY